MFPTIDIKEIYENPSNPRFIRDVKYQELLLSLKEFPEMLEKRPLVVHHDQEGKLVVLGGNMRLKACNELKFKEVPISNADDWTDEKKKRFLIIDNLNYGEWDIDMLANEFEIEDLSKWGLKIPHIPGSIELDKFFADPIDTPENKFKITLEFSEDEYNQIIEKLDSLSGSKEKIIFDLLVS
jgi:hypothetical protein